MTDPQPLPTWETCVNCRREYLYPHLCRTHMLCGLCHPEVAHA